MRTEMPEASGAAGFAAGGSAGLDSAREAAAVSLGGSSEGAEVRGLPASGLGRIPWLMAAIGGWDAASRPGAGLLAADSPGAATGCAGALEVETLAASRTGPGAGSPWVKRGLKLGLEPGLEIGLAVPRSSRDRSSALGVAGEGAGAGSSAERAAVGKASVSSRKEPDFSAKAAPGWGRSVTGEATLDRFRFPLASAPEFESVW